ncbi:excinuclease ABC subunit UvrA [Chondromyces crocatus]|uniref:UvrABC system protein A n=1 Tax=Chondromyces crocatus TaxID=52 RepID=A0A0K1EM65_CHOCO|nr:excinuclease ABC subunit UvrA [Chondromyces crocatus]AKT41906.1 excinuclease ABC subunit A [Chondromyces crocatus]
MHPIRLRGARTHNLQSIDLDFHPGELVAITGVSGAGKSSLALDTLYAEGQRRFVESFSPYARQFLERLERPPIESLDPVAAGVAVDRRAPVKSSRSTVATMADLEPYLSAVFSREAIPVCPDCHVPAQRTDPVAAAERVATAHAGAKALVTYRVPVLGPEAYLDVRESLAGAGYRRLLVRGEARDLDEIAPSEALSGGTAIDVIVDRLRLTEQDRRRLGAAIEEAWRQGGGAAALHVVRPEASPSTNGSVGGVAETEAEAAPLEPQEKKRGRRAKTPLHDASVAMTTAGRGKGRGATSRGKKKAAASAQGSEALDANGASVNTPSAVSSDGTSGQGLSRVPLVRGLSCPSCARSFDPPRPGLFSYQSPAGACPACRGFGRTIGIDWNKVFPEPHRALDDGAIRPWSGKSTTWERRVLKRFCEREGIPFDRPWSELSEAQQNRVLDGEGSWSGGKFPGVRAWFKWLETRTYKMHVRVLLARYRAYDPCDSCGGKRLSPESLLYQVGGLDLAAWHGLELRDARTRLDALRATTTQGELSRRELSARLTYLERVGLGYLTLDRQARTLSGGEAQRVSLTAALGTSLTGALFVLDEPTVGLHPSDIPPLLGCMRELADSGNAVLVIEHEPLVIEVSDRVVELGPEAGRKGGKVVHDGSPAARPRLPPPAASVPARRSFNETITIVGARANNLRSVTARIPLGCVVAVTGPSGSGKSTLVEEILYRHIARARGYKDVDPPGIYTRVENTAGIRAVTLVDQSPLGRTSRGNPATYSGAWNRIRALFAQQPGAVERKLTPSHFSFNVALGRCEACAGEGSETIEMQFLADVSVTCPSCKGRRFQDIVLEVKLDGRSVADVLALTIDEALEVFSSEGAIQRTLRPLQQLGLGYLGLGQPLSTLSGGEAQRLKVARALADACVGALFLLDEPSAGLHPSEVARLNAALSALVTAGASVIVVDHDLDVIGAADWILDIGPGAGIEGGTLVAEGTPEDVARTDTRTGKALAAWFAQGVRAEGAADREAGVASASRPRRRADAKKQAPDGAVASADAPGAERREGLRRPAHAELPHAIEVTGAREHNLHEVSVSIPHGKLVVVTGPSGSGKSTLSFDVVFAEGQRRFLETLTPYARQFLPTLPRPDVDRVTGVPPSIALEQRTTRSGANSTVATVTEIAHYLRLLYAKVGDAHCPKCDIPIQGRAAEALYDDLRATRGKRTLLAPAVVARKGTYLDVFTAAARAGIQQAIADGVPCSTDVPPKLDKRKEHSIDLVIYEGRLADLDRALFDRALTFGKGSLKIVDAKGDTQLHSTTRTCPRCGQGVPELDPRWFSFNTKQGRCESCEGTGVSGHADDALQTPEPCEACEGSRLAPIPRAVRLAGERYHEAAGRAVGDAASWARTLAFTGDRARIAEAPHRELCRRLDFVTEVGLDYLALDRPAGTLSGGEMQRLRLAAQLGSGLTGALYVLDEPTIGLHPRDTQRLLGNLRKLADTGSTILMVEHDADTIRAADHLVDLGPSGGRSGGRILAAGTPAEVLSSPASPTGRALAAEASLASPARPPRPPAEAHVELIGARAHNLRVDRLHIPVGRMTVVAGVSGSGKSTLVQKVLYPAIRRGLGLEAPEPGPHEALRLPRGLTRALAVDQSPIGRTSRSVPATFLGIWDEIRRLYAATPDAQIRGYDAGRFSFNTAKGGRCPTCEGQGVISHEMAFLPDAVTVCEACGGGRFEPATLDVQYNGRSIGDVLGMTAEEAVELFANHLKIRAPLATMCDLGVGYLHLGQGSHTLSGGEAQRLKLASELTAGLRPKPTLYVLDEPTTGLHLADVARLLDVLDRLVERGDTLVIVEHHPAVIARADHIVELGPEGGSGGGQLVAEGTPREIAKKKTATGKVLKELFGRVG